MDVAFGLLVISNIALWLLFASCADEISQLKTRQAQRDGESRPWREQR